MWICDGRNQIELGWSRRATGDISPVLESFRGYKKIVGSRFSICFPIFSTRELQVGENREKSRMSQSGIQPIPGLCQIAQNRIFKICYGRNQIELGGSRCATGDISPVLDSSCMHLKIVGSRFLICFAIFFIGTLQVE